MLHFARTLINSNNRAGVNFFLKKLFLVLCKANKQHVVALSHIACIILIMKLSELIETVGEAEIAKLTGAKERTVSSWRRGERTPSSATALVIFKRYTGFISLAEILENRAGAQ